MLPSKNNTVVSVFGFDPYRIGAGEIFARELSEQLAARGWHSVLCFLKPPPEPVRRFLELPNVTIEVVEDSWQLSAKATVRLLAVLKRYRPRILHLYFTGFLSAYPWMAKLLLVQKVYFTDQGSQPEGFVQTRAPLWKRAAMRVINAPLTGVISVSGYGYRNFTARDLLPKQRFHMIYNSVDVARAGLGLARGGEFRRRYGIPADRLVVTQVSWLIPEKGVDDLLAAARDVVAAEPRAHFVLAGDGAHRPNLEQAARDLGIAAHVTFTGVVSDPLAEGLFAASDVVCQMSRWEEVFGYVNAEAMASGKPLIGTRAGGIPEIIEHGKTGYLVDRRDTAAMASRILELLRDPDLRRRMGEAGRQRAVEKFNHKTNVGQLVKLYGI
ncbi:MAG TPA: glycosyltransferase family 4 protein [Candidatus Acidoferrales bacterium]|nr:glycosyltransferase family 4 protein [Candidatus Acidoferrales bacterium]